MDIILSDKLRNFTLTIMHYGMYHDPHFCSVYSELDITFLAAYCSVMLKVFSFGW
jgi:hypothetical protein